LRVNACNIALPPKLFFYFFTAGGTFSIFKKLRFTAAPVGTGNHQGRAAFFALFTGKGLVSADRAGDIQRPAAS